MRINTVIFDIGKVLVGYDWDKLLMSMFGDKELSRKIKAAVFESGVWEEVDRGIMAEDEILQNFYKNGVGIEEQILRFWNEAGEALWQYDHTRGLIQDLKDKGYKVLYLSNWSAHMREVASKQLDFLPMMDGGVFSYEEKLIKPEHAIYERILSKYDLNASECVFLDDIPNNVAAARECGMNAILVKDMKDAIEELFRMLEQ